MAIEPNQNLVTEVEDPSSVLSSGEHLPVVDHNRLGSIDVLRGFALLGILILNIQSFGLISAKYLNPTALGTIAGVDYGVWWLTSVFGELKFMTLFSILFGAGIVLMWEKSKKSGRKFTSLHYRRMFWLVLFGLVHGHLLWEGDILFTYGVCGMIVYWLCGLKPRWLIPIGIALFSMGSFLYIASGLSVPYWSEQDISETMKMWKPTAEQVAAELSVMRGSWIQQLPLRSSNALFLETFVLMIWGFWRVSGLMLFGMALLKLGILSAKRSERFYVTGAVVGLLIGLSIGIAGISQNNARDWSFDYSFFLGSQFNYWGSVFMSFGYMCIVMLCFRRGWFLDMQMRLAAVGRMALTNYLLHTIICTTIFYGHGLGWFGYMSRLQLFGVVASIWIFQLIISPIWLNRYRFGPLEWLWRSLSYWKVQPMLR